jgi:GIY-YIG catalytic domain
MESPIAFRYSDGTKVCGATVTIANSAIIFIVMFIYALCDPQSGEIRYIGKADDVAKRLKGHLRERRRDFPLYRWIAKLRRRGGVPAVVVLEECSPDSWQPAERQWIRECRQRGVRLLNVANGGDEPICSIQTRRENGRAVASLIHRDSYRKRIWNLKRQVGLFLFHGWMDDREKAKLRLAASIAPELFGEFVSIT